MNRMRREGEGRAGEGGGAERRSSEGANGKATSARERRGTRRIVETGRDMLDAKVTSSVLRL